ncbi:MAG: coiled coil domain-containing protein [Gammaproteobacteria bacterium]
METKQSYQEKMTASLQEWQAKIDLLKAKADKAKANQKLKYQEEIESLQTKQQQLQHKLDELRDSGESAWKDIKTGVDQAWKDLKNAVDRAGDKF